MKKGVIKDIPSEAKICRRNTKHFRRTMRELNNQISALSGEKNKFSEIKDKMTLIVSSAKHAGFFRRLVYLFSGNVKHLIPKT